MYVVGRLELGLEVKMEDGGGMDVDVGVEELPSVAAVDDVDALLVEPLDRPLFAFDDDV